MNYLNEKTVQKFNLRDLENKDNIKKKQIE